MPVPVSQMWTVATYVIRQKLAGRKQYPLVLMLEPLFRCNLACAGCGKIQYPAHILKKDLTPEECFRAVDECGAPMVSIPGGEPLMHPADRQDRRRAWSRARNTSICARTRCCSRKSFTCSRRANISLFRSTWTARRDHHDFSVCREGGFEDALDGIKAALQRGFRVTTNTTLFDGTDPNSVRAFL